MSARSKADKIRMRLNACELLRLMKKFYTYEELSSMLGLPIPVISRYVTGRVLPEYERALGLLKKYGNEFISELAKKEIAFTEAGILDHSKLLSDIPLLEMAAKLAFAEFSEKKVDKVLTMEVDGIVFATLVAREFGAGLLIVKGKKEMGIREFVEVKRPYPSGTYSYIFLPKGLASPKERILIVDDFIRTGLTVEAMVELCKRIGGMVVGTYSLIAFPESLRKLSKKLDVKSLLVLDKIK
ncbi:MAG: adenine phosphoribosyltransferase [Thaumarchaeota archaeon]|nr:adenine phosphoribosyltransferase [Nitrososphaerota archaeon]